MKIMYNCFSKKICLIIFLALIAVAPVLFAQQSGSIRGKITDKNTGDGLIGANVIINGTSMGAASDIKGNFIVRDIPVGTYKLTISYIGYNSESTEVTVQPNRILEQNFSLEAKTLEGTCSNQFHSRI